MESLQDQCDEIYVYLDDYNHEPEALKNNPKVSLIWCQYLDKRYGDAGKFYWIHEKKGYYFSCDDDLIYPPDYIKTLKDKIDYFDRTSVVTCHGRILQKVPIKSYYSNNDTAFKFSCLNQLKKDTFIQVGGTGVMGFHTDTLKVHIDDFKAPNMADIWMAKLCQEQQVPQVCIKHERGWISHQHMDVGHPSIYKSHARQDDLQTKVINSMKWNLYTYKQKIRNGLIITA